MTADISAGSGSTIRGWRRRRRRRTWLVTGAIALVAATGIGAAVGFGRPSRPTAVASTGPMATATVTRGDLVDEVTLAATIGYGEPLPLNVAATGTLTWLPAAGTTVTRGQPLARVDEKPTVLLYGSLPMYRALTANAKGEDVRQFERNLSALGYDGFTVDDTYSASTAEVVKQWQRNLGVPESGSVGVHDVAYAAGALRVASQLVRVGAAAPVDALGVTGTVKVVTAALDPDDAGWAVPGAAVTVVLPDEKTVAGKVAASQAPTAQDGQGANGGVRITVTVADQKALADATSGLTVRYALRSTKDVLSVPVSALLALAEGGYGVEVVDGGATRIVAVRAGMFAAGRVEISGAGIAEGTVVRMPK